MIIDFVFYHLCSDYPDEKDNMINKQTNKCVVHNQILGVDFLVQVQFMNSQHICCDENLERVNFKLLLSNHVSLEIVHLIHLDNFLILKDRISNFCPVIKQTCWVVTQEIDGYITN